MLKLLSELKVGDWFHFYMKPDRKLMKTGREQYLSPSGFRSCNEHVAIFEDAMQKEEPMPSVFEQIQRRI